MRRSIVPERFATAIEWKAATTDPSALSYCAEVVTLELYKYFRLLLASDDDSIALGEARRALVAALVEYRTRGKEFVSLLFTGKTIFVDGLPLRAPRATHEAAQTLGRMCANVDASEVVLSTDLASSELVSIEPSLRSYLRAEGAEPDTQRLSFRTPPESVLTRGIDIEERTPDDELVRAYASSVVLLAAMLEAPHKVPQAPSPALKRASQVLSRLTSVQALARLRVTRKMGALATPAARTVRAAMLASAMGRMLGLPAVALSRLALVCFLRELGVFQAARHSSGQGGTRAPEEAAAVVVASNATGLEAQRRSALVFESLSLEGEVGARPPSFLAQLVYFARKCIDLVESSASASPSPKSIVQQLHDTKAGGSYLPALRLLAAVLGVAPPTSEQRRRLPSLSAAPESLEGTGRSSVPANGADWGAVHEGEIARTPLPHVLVFMLDYRLSGTIVFVEPDAAVHRVYFENGAPSLATASPGTRRLGEILRDEGLLPASEVENAVLLASTFGVRLGEFLVGEDRIERADLDRALVAQLTERVAALVNLPPNARYEYVADENLLAEQPGGEEPLVSRPLAILTAAVRNWSDRARIERALRRVEDVTLKLTVRGDEADVRAFAFTDDELGVYHLVAAGGARLVSLLRAGVPANVVETVVSILYMTRHLEVPGEVRTPVLEPRLDLSGEISSTRLPLGASDENMVERVLGSIALQRQAEEAVLEGDLEKAEVHASEAARLNPDERENGLLVAWLAAQQDPDLLHDAERVALALLEKEPQSEFGLLYYARICRDLGRQGEAKRIYADLLRLYPNNVAATKERAVL